MAGTCELKVTRYYSAPREEVWAAITEPDSLRRWLAPPGAIELRREGPFQLELEDGAMDGRIRALDPPRVLEIDWRDSGQPSVVRFELRRDGDGTVLVLDHHRIDAAVGMREAARWERRLARLDRMVER